MHSWKYNFKFRHYFYSMKYIYILLTLFIVIFHNDALSQIDSLRFTNGNLIIGEIKSMDKGVLEIETDYSENDFEIEWKEIVWLRTQSYFLIILENNTKYYSTIHSLNDSISRIIGTNNQLLTCNTHDIVLLSAYDDNFKNRFNAEISVGFDMTKSSNLQSFTTRSAIGYKAEKWSTNGAFNTLISHQDSVEDIKRTDAELNYRYILKGRWYAITTFTALSNTEQKLDLRTNIQLGLGRYIFITNKANLGAKFGVNRNIEQYTNETEDRQTWEGYFGTELDIYDIGDLNLIFNAMAYPSFSEKNRWRIDTNFDMKYDLPLDFFIKMGISMNYDNQPADDASELDYVLHTGFGWEW